MATRTTRVPRRAPRSALPGLAPPLLALLGCLAARPAGATDIGIFADPRGTACGLIAPVHTPGAFYVLGILSFADGHCMTGAEFRIEGFPSDWLVTGVTANPAANIVLGDPMAAGTNLAFQFAQTGINERTDAIRLFTISFFATSSVQDRRLRIVMHSTPTSPEFPCPLVTLCDSPAYTKLCVRGGEAVLNGTQSPCTVAVRPAPWSAVKELFRDATR